MVCTLRYIGSKRTILPKIRDVFTETWTDLSEYTLVDAFFGSGGFSTGMVHLFGKLVVNDAELFSFSIAHALFRQNAVEPVVCSPVEGGYITREYCADEYVPGDTVPSRMFFSVRNGKLIDAHRARIRSLVGVDRLASIGDLVAACDAVANTSGTYGAFMKKLDGAATKEVRVVPIRMWCADVPPRPTTVTMGDATVAALAAPPRSVLYLDPPYVKRGYGCNYFPINVIADVDNDPELRGVTGIPVTGYNRSAWNKAGSSAAELDKILAGTPARRVVLSYSVDGLMTRSTILDAFKRHGWTVKVHVIPHKRYVSHDRCKKLTEFHELLFVGERATHGASR